MPEATADAAILIAASYQAMNRAAAGDPRTQLCDCTVTVAFAGFYIEANLNHVIAELGRESDSSKYMVQTREGHRRPGFLSCQRQDRRRPATNSRHV
jgi:hypothetical protein